MLSQPQRKLYCGRTVAPAELNQSSSGWDFVVAPLIEAGRISFSDLELSSSAWNLVGLIDTGDEQLFARALAWGRHLMLPALICPLELLERIDLLRQVRAHLLDDEGPPLLVRAPWDHDGWLRWNRVRKLAEWEPRLRLCLEVGPGGADLERFEYEPIDTLWVAGAIDPEPVTALFRRGTERAIIATSIDEQRLGVQIAAIFAQAWDESLEKQRVAERFDDQLIPPVQPLRDHLPSSVYANFETAVPKYARYQEAIRAAMVANRPATIAVAGAGRGPLVQVVLQTARALGQSPRLYAIEKNPNALVTLAERNRREWGDRVQLAEADMRVWTPPEPMDLVISELLGSFADNELSPECLDGPERWLAPGGISIPSSSTSYLAPVFGPRLYAALGTAAQAWERPVGITLNRVRMLAEPQPCFRFVHPGPQAEDAQRAKRAETGGRDHRRFTELRFVSDLDALLTGFIGCFEADLFGDVSISTRPGHATPDMGGWSILYFPLAAPIDVVRGGEIKCAFFREQDQRSVWYEWAVLAPEVSRIHNPGGRTEVMSK